MKLGSVALKVLYRIWHSTPTVRIRTTTAQFRGTSFSRYPAYACGNDGMGVQTPVVHCAGYRRAREFRMWRIGRRSRRGLFHRWRSHIVARHQSCTTGAGRASCLRSWMHWGSACCDARTGTGCCFPAKTAGPEIPLCRPFRVSRPDEACVRCETFERPLSTVEPVSPMHSRR